MVPRLGTDLRRGVGAGVPRPLGGHRASGAEPPGGLGVGASDGARLAAFPGARLRRGPIALHHQPDLRAKAGTDPDPATRAGAARAGGTRPRARLGGARGIPASPRVAARAAPANGLVLVRAGRL